MSDLYWLDGPDCGHQGCLEALRDEVVSRGMAKASREWHCTLSRGLGPCTPDRPHKRCGWFVEAKR